ncbi:unnamed protein product [Prunus armeniaca]|uniref:Uncharacterized protein n=1 Tax=Prunus armeniaca TaxID=36596 RepID=A0A6J5VH38_PRUAR|nr:unnamed protein product [Prunus armeniaca]
MVVVFQQCEGCIQAWDLFSSSAHNIPKAQAQAHHVHDEDSNHNQSQMEQDYHTRRECGPQSAAE